MPRQPRVVIEGQPHHVIQRGNNRQDIFKSAKDYNYYLSKLQETSDEYDCDVHAYVLMTNHIHLLITPAAQENLGNMMRKLGTCFVSYFNYNYERSGSLFEGRYKSSTITNEAYFFICMKYIELNPVRAGIVSHPADYPWSSYHANALSKMDSIIAPHSLYLTLGKNKTQRKENYREFFSSDLSEKDISKIRASSRKSAPLI